MLKYFNGCETLEEVKQTYKKWAFKLHPDVTGEDTTAEFQEMANEYEAVFDKVKNFHKNMEGEIYQKETTETPKEYADIIGALFKMQGVIIEVIGSFLWLSGNTKAYKDNIKALGFRWSKNKSMWYKSPAGYHKTSRKAYQIGEIRGMFGSEILKQKQGLEEIEA